MFIDTIEIGFSAGEEAEKISQDFFINRIVSQNSDRFTSINPLGEIQDNIHSLIKQEQMKVQRQLEPLGKKVSEVGWRLAGANNMRWVMPNESRPAWIFQGDDVNEGVYFSFIIRGDDKGKEVRNHLFALSKSRSDAAKFSNFLKESVERIVDIVGKDYVVLKGIEQREGIIGDFLDGKKGITDWSVTESENEFEEEIQQEISEIIGTYVPNVKVNLQSGEETEYDIVAMPLGKHGNKFAIEAKDFSYVEEEIQQENHESSLSTGSLKSKLITQPNDSAGMLDLDLIMIVKAMDRETYENLRVLAEQRNVVLLTDENYSEALEELLIDNSLTNFPKRPQRGLADWEMF